MKEFIYNGKSQRLSKIMAENFPLFSYNQIIRLIKNKDIRIDGEKTGEDCIVSSGSVIRCYAKDVSFKEIYQDDNILVIYKPKGIASEGIISAESIVSATNENVVLCHRLDTNTDGLLMFAKSKKAFGEIIKGFKNGYVLKVYFARVNGRILSDVIYKDFLIKNSQESSVKIFSSYRPSSVEIITSVKVVGYEDDTTYIEATIHNGKTHQIRAQLAAHGHFILGDGKYGRDDINRKYNYKKQQLTAKKLCFSFPKTSFLYYLNDVEIEI